MKTDLERKFLETYQQEPTATYFTPGRVNLIGEHIDYNGGLVMPCAITLVHGYAWHQIRRKSSDLKALIFQKNLQSLYNPVIPKPVRNGLTTHWVFLMKF